MWKPLLRSQRLIEIGAHIGLRPWVTVGDIEIENGQVIGAVYGLELFKDEYNPRIEVAAWHEIKLERTGLLLPSPKKTPWICIWECQQHSILHG
jgi:hypothetical protein